MYVLLYKGTLYELLTLRPGSTMPHNIGVSVFSGASDSQIEDWKEGGYTLVEETTDEQGTVYDLFAHQNHRTVMESPFRGSVSVLIPAS